MIILNQGGGLLTFKIRESNQRKFEGDRNKKNNSKIHAHGEVES